MPKVIKAIIFLIYNSIIPYTCKIGNQSKFAYGAIGVVIHSRAQIGERVIIGQSVTIGRKLDAEGVPTIGDDVYIGAGARILGGVTIGNNVIIGANAVVINDITCNSIVVGIPAKVIKKLDANIYDLIKGIY